MSSIFNQIKSCETIPGVSARCVMITPYIAKKLLECNTKNRNISKAVVNKYVTEVNEDEWMLSASGIGFDRDGVLCDGQHRLSAIYKSGKTVPMLVVLGLAPKSQEKIDRQRKRSLFDVFKLGGYADTRKEVQIATFLTYYDRYKMGESYRIPADVDVKNMLNCHKPAIDDILGKAARFSIKGVTRSSALAAVVLYYEVSPDNALKFLDGLLTGQMLTLDSPPMRLRNNLMSDVTTQRFTGGAAMQISVFKKTMYAINAFEEGRNISRIKETDKFCFNKRS